MIHPQMIIESEDEPVLEIPVGQPGSGGSLATLLESRGLPLNTRCGQRGLCRGCEVELLEGTLQVGESLVQTPVSLRACKAYLPEPPLQEGLRVRVPGRSRIEHWPQVSESFRLDLACPHQPLFPARGARDTAFAVDIGTTTVAVLVIDIASGRVLSRAGGFNVQIRFGDNVLTRIDAARDPGRLHAMQRAVVDQTITPLLRRACERAGRAPSRLAGGVVAGNTSMLHLLLAEDPTGLGVAPFTPRFLEGRQVAAARIGLELEGFGAETALQLLPGIAGYIGADITAGIQATGMLYDLAPSVLVDIGTNGEMVLQRGGKLLACATAAGPAFEGCGLTHGARAREGAISGVTMGREPFAVRTETIGNVPAARADGICGSAYVDFLAEARRIGLLDPSGRFAGAVWNELPTEYRVEEEGVRALRLLPRGKPAISEADVALLLQAKAAIAAGLESLLDTAGITAREIGRVYLAGGFGMHLDVGNAIAAGLLPGFRGEQIQVVGNSALAGAMLALLDRDSLGEMEALRKCVQVLELNLLDDFEDRYIDHLLLP